MEIASMPPMSLASSQSATVFVALELSKSRWLVGIHSPVADKVSCHSVVGGDTTALLGLIGCYRRQAEEHLKRPVTTAFGCIGRTGPVAAGCSRPAASPIT